MRKDSRGLAYTIWVIKQWLAALWSDGEPPLPRGTQSIRLDVSTVPVCLMALEACRIPGEPLAFILH